jgi:hypothetical protein
MQFNKIKFEMKRNLECIVRNPVQAEVSPSQLLIHGQPEFLTNLCPAEAHSW